MGRNVVLLLAAAVLVVVPLVLPVTQGMDRPFVGADNHAVDAITAGNPDYQPWFQPLWKPPSAEIEGMLFALQAALGAGLIGYCVGYRRGRQARPAHPGNSSQADPQAGPDDRSGSRHAGH